MDIINYPGPCQGKHLVCTLEGRSVYLSSRYATIIEKHVDNNELISILNL